MNRGRIQAQGGGTEKSEPWALDTTHYKSMGITGVDSLATQLTRQELTLRANALQQCRNRILTTPSYGVSAQMKKSYYDDYTNRKVRVDIEVNAGVAFVDDPLVQEN
jgi:hypothetical protein